MARPYINDLVKYFEKNYLPEPNSGCWLWIGALFWDGYGQFNYKIGDKWKKQRAHRASLILHGRPPNSSNLYALHSCDIPSCVNPDHLFWGTPLDNSRNMDAKKRRARVGSKGINHPNAKLTAEQVISIRNDPRKRSEIAVKYNVQWSTIDAIKKKRSWNHL